MDIDKCEFSTKKVKYLGIIVTTDGIEINTKNVEAIQKWKAPASIKEVQAFMGFANFYHRFISDFSKKVRPLIDLTRGTQYTTKFGKKKLKYQAFDWTTECQQAFEDLKRVFTTAPILTHYNSILETWLETDASNFVMAGVLSQMHDKCNRPKNSL